MPYLPFWKQVCDGMPLVKDLSGPPRRQPRLRRPDMRCQARGHRWGHGSPQTPRASSTGRLRRCEPGSHAVVRSPAMGLRPRPPPWWLAPCQVRGAPGRAPCEAPLALTLGQGAPGAPTAVDGPAARGGGPTCRSRFWEPADAPGAAGPQAPALAPVDALGVP
jgi:hypothetical protein